MHGSRFYFESLDVPLEWMSENARAYRDAEPHLLRIADEFGADLIHSNQFCFGALPVSSPVVITAHSDVLSWAEACRSGRLEDTGWLRQYRSMVARGLYGAASVLAPTRWMLEALAGNFLLPRQLEVIPNGRALDRAEHGRRKLQAVTAGRLWDEAKDVSLLADVVSPMPLLVAGDAQCENTAIDPRIAKIQTLGLLGEEDLLSLFRESAIYICTSRYEPFGLAPLEAALCGCALLARDIPSLREVWGGAALYFNNAADLTALLRILAAKPAVLSRAQERSRRRAAAFSTERMVRAYHAHFSQALKRMEAQVHVA